MTHVDAVTPLALSIQDTAKQLSVSPQSVRKLIERGELKTRRVGVRVLIPRTELERFLSIGQNKMPHSSESEGKGEPGSSRVIIPHLSCVRCASDVIPTITSSGPSLRAACPTCKTDLCFLPRRSPWLALLEVAA